MNLDLSNKNALVCGSTQGIGLATALVLAEMGATVWLLARDKNKLREILPKLSSSLGQKHQFLCADFSDIEQVKEVANTISTLSIHILINNTGGPAAGPIKDAKVEAFEKAFSMHLLCNQLLTQAVLKHMQSSCFGRIVNIISTSVKVPINGLGVSNTIRGAVASWSKTMANELGEHGITVNNVLPGFTNTNRLTSLISKKASAQNQTEEAIAQQMLASVPAQRFGEAQEVANAIAFLCSPAAGYINGINLPVDGGRTGTL